MALIARVAGDSWDWRDEGEGNDGPLTSRSPSFVCLAGATQDAESGRIEIAEAPDSLSPPSGDAEAEFHEWRDRDVTLSTRALKLEESVLAVHDARITALVDAVLDDAAEVSDGLRALQSACAAAWRHGAPSETLVTSLGTLVRHVYEWASNVMLRADDFVSGVVVAYDEGELGVAEYSSLFVRAIIDPLLIEALEACAEEGDVAVTDALAALREKIVWLNWAARDVA